MERALDLAVLAEALGAHDALPSAEQLQDLIAEVEVGLFIRQPTPNPRLLTTAWYLHGVASADSAAQIYSPVRQRRAFVVSAHVFDLATALSDVPIAQRLEWGFAAAIGYMRGGLEPNSRAIYQRLRSSVASVDTLSVRGNDLALRAGLALLSLETRELFRLFARWRRDLTALAEQVGSESLRSTAFGTTEAVVVGGEHLLYYLAFGDRQRLERGRTVLADAAAGGAGPADVNGRWVAAHLEALSGDIGNGSVWALMPPDLPPAAKQAFTLGAPPVLTFWEPQRQLLESDPSALSPDAKRLVVRVPTSGGKTLIAQLLMVSHLAQGSSSVCYVAPTRSLAREVRRAMGSRLRVLQKEVGIDLPDFSPFSSDGGTLRALLEELVRQRLGEDFDEPDIEVLTPERLAHMVRHDPDAVLSRFGMFIFDEAQLVGEPGRGFVTESLISYFALADR